MGPTDGGFCVSHTFFPEHDRDFFALKERTALHYLRDEEVRFYLWILLVATVAVSAVLYWEGVYDGGNAIRIEPWHLYLEFDAA